MTDRDLQPDPDPAPTYSGTIYITLEIDVENIEGEDEEDAAEYFKDGLPDLPKEAILTDLDWALERDTPPSRIIDETLGEGKE